ncbi:MAG: GNAT family N-acetyltransferase [Clostridia bacterium]
MFDFLKMDYIKGDEIDLVIEQKIPERPEIGYVPQYHYKIVLHGSDTKVGSIGLRVGHNENTYYAGNIGYGIDKEYRGRHFAAKACMLIKKVAMAHGMDHLVITCNPGNTPSRKTCEYLGARLVEIVTLPADKEMYKAGERRKCRYEWLI